MFEVEQFYNAVTTGSNLAQLMNIYSKTLLFWTNWERTFVKSSESPNYWSATENIYFMQYIFFVSNANY
jgi:hypothetical protein